METKRSAHFNSSRNFVDKLRAVILYPGATGWYAWLKCGTNVSGDGCGEFPF